jgi:hypothetical protein
MNQDQELRLRKPEPRPTSISLTPKESSLLKLLRTNKYNRIEIEMKNGELGQIYVDEEISTANTRIDDIIRSNAYQTITITKHDGEVVRLNRRIPIKLD